MVPLVHRLAVTSVRRSVTTIHQPAVPGPAVQPPLLPTLSRSEITTVHRSELIAVHLPQVTGVHRPRGTAVRWLAATAVAAAAVVLFAIVPAWVADLATGSGLWDLARSFAPGAPRPGVSGHVLPLLLGSIVVLAALSSSSGSRRHDHW